MEESHEQSVSECIKKLVSKQAQLYRIYQWSENTTLCFFHCPVSNGWDLELFVVSDLSPRESLNGLKQFLVNELRYWKPPRKIRVFPMEKKAGHPFLCLPLTWSKAEGVHVIHDLNTEEILEIFSEFKSPQFGNFPEKTTRIAPWIAVGLLIVFIAQSFAAQWLLPGKDAVFQEFGVSLHAFASGKWWVLLSGIIMHDGVVHIGFNVCWCILLGLYLERFYHPVCFLILFLITGICGSLLSVSFNPGISVGISGAVLGLQGALISVLALGRKKWDKHYSMQSDSLLKAMVALGFAGYMMDFFIPRLDSWGHTGGLIGGLLLGPVLARSSKGFRYLFLLLFCGYLWLCGNITFDKVTVYRERLQANAALLDMLNRFVLPEVHYLQVRILRRNPEDRWFAPWENPEYKELRTRLNKERYSEFFKLESSLKEGRKLIEEQASAEELARWYDTFARLQEKVLEAYNLKLLKNEK